jgi:hypothetical protein
VIDDVNIHGTHRSARPPAPVVEESAPANVWKPR